MYQLIENGVRRLSDSADITNHDCRDWRTYTAWLDEGNEALPIADPPVLFVDENEDKIQAELRKIAISNLGSELPYGYK